MGKENQGLKDAIIRAFPGLATDRDFAITSPKDSNYNCLAWACNYSNRWMQPPISGDPVLDAIVYWPPNAKQGSDVSCLVEAFEAHGYKVCDTWVHEPGFQKVALYKNPFTNEWTHAARELMNGSDCGKWTSKLGEANDIRHGTPFSIEGGFYGVVHCIMKREYR
ncbi:MAG: hypothetical protein IKX53_00490 [Bacteroidales bacterium]|nr:hypothetical protein [Bacteroidales bacterium]